jgi:hypothetical protein
MVCYNLLTLLEYTSVESGQNPAREGLAGTLYEHKRNH